MAQEGTCSLNECKQIASFLFVIGYCKSLDVLRVFPKVRELLQKRGKEGGESLFSRRIGDAGHFGERDRECLDVVKIDRFFHSKTIL